MRTLHEVERVFAPAALFGDSPPERWRPWGVGHCVLRADSLEVGDLAVQ